MANIVPFSCANFSTSLATAISSSASSLVLASITTDDGVILPTKTYGITVDQGTNSHEHMIVTFSGTTTGTIVTRGVSVVDGTTNIPALQFAHARGASVKFTDHPILIRMLRILEGTDTLDTKLSYTSHPTFTANTQLIDKKYADDLAISGSPDASTTVKGIIEIATSSEAAAGTSAGATGALLVPPNSIHNATSSAAIIIPVTDAAGKISAGFGGSASTLATLNGSAKVVEDPANATATATASKIPIADGSGLLDTWVTGNKNSSLTTGEAIDGSTTPQVVCIKAADGLVYKADANDSTRVMAYGFVTTNASISTTPAVTIQGILGGFTGLTKDVTYYASDTAGAISVTPSTTTQIPVGRAISATQLELFFGKKVAFASITHTTNTGTTNDQTITVGFQPAFVLCDVAADNASTGATKYYGSASFIGTGSFTTMKFLKQDGAGTALTTSNIGTTFISSLTSPIAFAGSSSNRDTASWSINSITSTGFVSRQASALVAGAGSTTTTVINFVIFE